MHVPSRLRRARRTITAALAALAVAGFAASCGSNGSSTGGNGSGSGERVVKIGVIAPLDAGLTSFGLGIEHSVQLAVDEANERNAIPGWTIELMAVDDSSDPETGAAAATTLADDAAIVGVIGPYNSGVAAEAAPILSDAGIALISPSNTDPTLTVGSDPNAPERQFDTYFRMVATDAQQGPFLARYAVEHLEAATVGVVSEAKPVSRGLADDFRAAFTPAGGEVVYDMTVPDGTTDYATIVADLATLMPDLLFFGGEYDVAAAFRVAAADIDAPVMGGDGIKDDAYIEGAGARAEGDVASTVGIPLDSLETASAFVEAYDAAGFGEPPTDYGAYAYDAANLLIGAAAAALGGNDEVTAEVRAAVVASVQAADTDGVSGAIAFDEFGDITNKVLTVYRVTDGAWVALASEPVD